jgi:hypothetical protein
LIYAQSSATVALFVENKQKNTRRVGMLFGIDVMSALGGVGIAILFLFALMGCALMLHDMLSGSNGKR